MKTSLLPIAFAAMLVSVAAHRSHAELVVVNGDFQDLTGLTAQGGGWYNGTPTGWTGVPASTFSVLNTGSSGYAANPSQLASMSPSFIPLWQTVGTVDATGPVTLKFDIVSLNNSAVNLAAAIWPNSAFSGVLATTTYTPTAPSS
jgi:hypothetical protein